MRCDAPTPQHATMWLGTLGRVACRGSDVTVSVEMTGRARYAHIVPLRSGWKPHNLFTEECGAGMPERSNGTASRAVRLLCVRRFESCSPHRCAYEDDHVQEVRYLDEV